MKLVRYINSENNEIKTGAIESGFIFPLLNNMFSKTIHVDKKNRIPIDYNCLTSPVRPGKVIGVAINYKGSTGLTQTMQEPLIFLKGNNTITSNNSNVRLPFDVKTWGEAELGIVIRKTTNNNLKLKNIKKYILGYIPANDVSCENIEDRDHHLARSKSPDGFCPIGTYIDTDYDYRNKKITAFHNNTLLREGNTNNMIWNPEKIIIWL